MPKASRSPEPKAEARIPCPALPTTAYAKINLIESPQIHSLPRTTDTMAASSGALWTSKPVVDNQTTHDNPGKINNLKRPPMRSLREGASKREQQIGSCGQVKPLWTIRRRRTRHSQDHPPQEPPIYSLPRESDKAGAATRACG
ncbi:hypothetical protein GCM10010483_60240 [Actinokineospora diospyrosa]